MMVAFDDFWSNVFRYPRYFIAVVLGIFFFLFDWVKPLLKRPISAIALVSLLISSLIFVVLTLQAMLGLSPV